jgi:hypothetical protein
MRAFCRIKGNVYAGFDSAQSTKPQHQQNRTCPKLTCSTSIHYQQIVDCDNIKPPARYPLTTQSKSPCRERIRYTPSIKKRKRKEEDITLSIKRGETEYMPLKREEKRREKRYQSLLHKKGF